MRPLMHLILFLIPFYTYSQIKTPEAPRPKAFHANSYYTSSDLKAVDQDQSDQRTYPMGGHASNFIAQQNAQAMKQMGYKPPVVPPRDPTLLAQFMQEQQKEYSERNRKAEELLVDLNEIRLDLEERTISNYYSSEKFRTESSSYWKAKEVLDQMLSGKIPLSLKDAFYTVENAYGDTQLTYAQYDAILKRSSSFIKQWMNEQGHSTTNNTALHFGIQSFMRDTLTVSKLFKEPSKVTGVSHFPFTYDYEDFRAEEDFTNYFVTKTLATGTGQCNSLPTTYLLLAEQLGAKAYLSYAPLHSFIKFPDDKGTIHNYEPTSHFEISDQWYADRLRISPKAYKNRIYLDTLDKKQIVAAAMMDLAYGYLRKHGVADGAFIDECVKDAIQHFPGKVANVQGWLLRSTLLTAKLHHILNRDGIRDLKDIHRSPEGNEVYNQLLAIDQFLDDLGYGELPADMYQQLIEQQNTKGRLQKNTINTKTKHDLFQTLK